MPREAILYLSHTVNNAQWRDYARLRRECAGFADVHYISNLNTDVVPPEFTKTFPITPTKRAALGHPSRTGHTGWWMDTGPTHTRDIQSGFDQAILVFRSMRPEYDYYWLVEHDVDFSGAWSNIIRAFADNRSDLLCSSLHRFETNPTWCWWNSIKWPDGAKPELVRGFFPIARLSGRAIDVIVSAGRDGIDGFYELVWPTVLHHKGLIIEDFGGDGEFVQSTNKNRWYTSTLTSQNLYPGTLVVRPIRFRPGREPNKLWHPVKPRFFHHVLTRLTARASLSWWMK